MQGQEPLSETVRKLLKEIPTDAHSHSVFVYLPNANLYEVKAELYVDGRTFPVVFVPTTSNDRTGTVSISYDVGNLESATTTNDADDYFDISEIA